MGDLIVSALPLWWKWAAFCRVLIQRTFACSHLGWFLQFTLSSTDTNFLSFLPIIIFQTLKGTLSATVLSLTQSVMIKLWFWFPFSEICLVSCTGFYFITLILSSWSLILSLSIRNGRVQTDFDCCSECVIQEVSSRPCLFNKLRQYSFPLVPYTDSLVCVCTLIFPYN